MKYSLLLLSLATAALTAPTTAQPEERQFFPGLGSGSESGSGSSTSSGSASSTTSTSAQGTNALPDIGDMFGSSSSSGTPTPFISHLSPCPSTHIHMRANANVRLVGGMTENGVKDNNKCQPLTFIFARGTSELGNMGSVVGPPVAKQLVSLTGNKVTVQGLDYPADAAGNAQMGATGGPKMASLTKRALKQCPHTKVVLGGYSQGSMVVHNAANSLDAGQITAAVLFGDPFKMQSVGKLEDSKRKEFCAQGDPVCLDGGDVMAHLSYGGDAEEAAKFLVKAAGVGSS